MWESGGKREPMRLDLVSLQCLQDQVGDDDDEEEEDDEESAGVSNQLWRVTYENVDVEKQFGPP